MRLSSDIGVKEHDEFDMVISICRILNILVQDARQRYVEIKSSTQNPHMHA
jgi:hypothetical protein